MHSCILFSFFFPCDFPEDIYLQAFNFAIFLQCVVPENIQTPTTEGIGNSRGVGGSEAQEIPEGRGAAP